MFFLGIDPSLSGTGLSVIQKINDELYFIDSQFIKTSTKDSIYVRLSIIQKNILEFLNKYNIGSIGMEETFLNKNASSSMKLTLVRGICYSCAIINNLPLHEYGATKIKKAITGDGGADKNKVLYILNNIVINFKVNSLDESDATATAVYESIVSRN